MLICPICRAPLSAVENGVACPANHRFDRARQGYLNLLPCSTRTAAIRATTVPWSKHGDAFDGGHYAPLARRLAELAAERAPQRWLDIGCGEGYYTAQLAEALPDAEGYALTSPAKRSSAPANARRNWNGWWRAWLACRWPMPAAICWPAYSARWTGRKRDACSPGGGLLRMGPTRDHLWELRARLYDEVRDYDDEKHLSLIPDGMRLTHSETLSYELQLDDAQARADLGDDPARLRARAARRRHRHAAGGAGCDTLRLDRTNF